MVQNTQTAQQAQTPHRRADEGLPKLGDGLAATGSEAFAASAERVVEYLNASTPITDWSVSRVTQGEQIHVHVHHDQVINPGDRVDWNESFCSRMSAGAAHVVRNSLADPDYSDLSAAQSVGAYAGYAISDDRGDMFGVLCGARVEPLRDEEVIDEQLVRLLSDLLSTQLGLSRGLDREHRRIELAEAMAQSDALTGVLNRRGWDRIVAEAQERIDGYGDPVGVAVVDLDGLKAVNDSEGHAAGDSLIRRTADVLRMTCPDAGYVARYGGDEFMILLNGVTPAEVENSFAAFRRALAAAGISASLGCVAAEPGIMPLERAIAKADNLMYVNKQVRRGR